MPKDICYCVLAAILAESLGGVEAKPDYLNE